ncbi:MAG: hypothetical protein AAFW68_10915 [Pseudomonadota bacterium]
MKIGMLGAVLVMAGFVITTAHANQGASGMAPCNSQTAPVDQLIDRADAIVIAAAIAQTPSREDDDLRSIQQEANKGGPDDQIKAGRLPVQLFSVAEYLKGEGPETLSLVYARAGDDAPLDAVLHSDEAFWSDPVAGRTSLTESCTVETRFLPGETYLLFVGPAHVKAYEAIARRDDPWLRYVRGRLDKSTPANP